MNSSMRKLFATLTSLFVLAAIAVVPALGQGQEASNLRPTHIIVFNEGVDVDRAVDGLTRAYSLRPTHTYRHAIQGMAAVVPEGRLNGLENDPRVSFVEADQKVHILGQAVPTGVKRTFADDNGEIDIDGNDDYRVDVDIAIIDTGVDLDHPDLNVVASTDCARGGPMNNGGCKDGDGDDGNGHGSHVAGTAAAIDNGIGVVGMAPGAWIHAVRVLDNSGSGWMSWIIAGIDWVTLHSGDIEVANMSLGCECDSDALDAALTNSVASGVAYAVAAGNSDKDASTFSPANHPDVFTTSALADFDGKSGADGSPTCRTDEDDTLANFSNWGSEIEGAAPGVCIYSTHKDGGYATYSGTSMASPHVAGALGLLASANNPSGSSDVANLYKTVMDNGNFNWIDDSGDDTQEPLLDVGSSTVFDPVLIAGSGGSEDTDTAPSVTITNPNDGSTVSGTVSVAADATDDNEVTQVEFFVDSISIGVDSDSSDGWSVSWDTTTYSEGSHTVTATATDTASQTSSDSVSVTVDNEEDTYPITLTVDSWEKVKGDRWITLSWFDATANGLVDLYEDGEVVATWQTESDGTGTNTYQGKGGGTHTYQVCEDADPTICSNEKTVSY